MPSPGAPGRPAASSGPSRSKYSISRCRTDSRSSPEVRTSRSSSRRSAASHVVVDEREIGRGELAGRDRRAPDRRSTSPAASTRASRSTWRSASAAAALAGSASRIAWNRSRRQVVVAVGERGLGGVEARILGRLGRRRRRPVASAGGAGGAGQAGLRRGLRAPRR